MASATTAPSRSTLAAMSGAACARSFVFDAKDFGQREASARQLLVQPVSDSAIGFMKCMRPCGVGGDHGVADGAQGGGELGAAAGFAVAGQFEIGDQAGLRIDQAVDALGGIPEQAEEEQGAELGDDAGLRSVMLRRWP